VAVGVDHRSTARSRAGGTRSAPPTSGAGDGGAGWRAGSVAPPGALPGPPPDSSSSRAASGTPPKAGQYARKAQKSHRRLGRGRKSSRSHARSTADHRADALRADPPTDCSDGVAMMATGSDR